MLCTILPNHGNNIIITDLEINYRPYITWLNGLLSYWFAISVRNKDKRARFVVEILNCFWIKLPWRIHLSHNSLRSAWSSGRDYSLSSVQSSVSNIFHLNLCGFFHSFAIFTLTLNGFLCAVNERLNCLAALFSVENEAPTSTALKE